MQEKALKLINKLICHKPVFAIEVIKHTNIIGFKRIKISEHHSPSLQTMKMIFKLHLSKSLLEIPPPASPQDIYMPFVR